MIKIAVVSYNNEVPSRPNSALFDQSGGILGRSEDSHFVLPDPKRYVSRMQASIRSDGDHHYIVNISQANPILINGQEIDPDREYALKIGDEIHIGLYLLRAESHLANVSRDSIETDGDADQDVHNPVAISAAVRADSPVVGADSIEDAVDPLGLGLLVSTASGTDPFADLLVAPIVDSHAIVAQGGVRGVASIESSQSASKAPPVITPLAASIPPVTISVQDVSSSHAVGFDDLLTGSTHPVLQSTQKAYAIPEDFNPFSLPSQATRNSDDPLADVADAGVTLTSFETEHAQFNNLLSPEPGLENGSPLDMRHLGKVDSTSVDPLKLFSHDAILPMQLDSGHGQDAMADNVAEIGAHFVLPQGLVGRQAKSDGAHINVVPVDQLMAAFSSQDSKPTSCPTSSALQESSANQVAVQGHPVLLKPEAEERAMSGKEAAQPAIAENDDRRVEALLDAFLRGAGLPPNTVQEGLTPELMETIGRVMATSVQSTIDLIASRALVKREVKADVTMIVVKDNNPLKFLPDSETVLMHMLRKKMPGFMGPVEAMQDACEDLRAHQIGVIAGMRAALSEVLKRFNPELLQQKLKDKSLLDMVMPASHKAKMWDRYAELFQAICLEAEDEFQTLFGRAFVAAYELEIERFKAGGQHG